MATALTLFPTVTASATVATARTLGIATAGVLTPVATTIAKRTGVHEIWSQGVGSGASALATGTALTLANVAPTGHGFLFDVTTLEAQALLSGSVQPILGILASAATISGRCYVRMYKRSSAGVYTGLQIWDQGSGSAFTAAVAQRTLPAASIPLTTFVAGDKLYIDVWVDVTANTANSTTASISLEEAGSTAGSITSFPTAGYQPSGTGTAALTLTAGDSSSLTFPRTAAATLTLTAADSSSLEYRGQTGTAALAITAADASTLSFPRTAPAALSIVAADSSSLTLPGTAPAALALVAAGAPGGPLLAAGGVASLDLLAAGQPILADSALAVLTLVASAPAGPTFDRTGAAALALLAAANAGASSPAAGTAVLSLAAPANGNVTFTGTAPALLQLLASGAAQAALSAAGTGVLSLVAAGTPQLAAAGAGVAVMSLVASGAAALALAGAAPAVLTLVAQAAAQELTAGAGSAVMTLLASGSATPAQAAAATAALSLLAASATPQDNYTDSGSAALQLLAAGAGQPVVSSSGAAVLTMLLVATPGVGLPAVAVATMNVTASAASSGAAPASGTAVMALLANAGAAPRLDSSGTAALALLAAGGGSDRVPGLGAAALQLLLSGAVNLPPAGGAHLSLFAFAVDVFRFAPTNNGIVPVDATYVDPGYVPSRQRYLITVGMSRTLSRAADDSSVFDAAATTENVGTGWDAWMDGVYSGGVGDFGNPNILAQAWIAVPVLMAYGGFYGPREWDVPGSTALGGGYVVEWEDQPGGITDGRRAFPINDTTKWGSVVIGCDFDVLNGDLDEIEVFLDPPPPAAPGATLTNWGYVPAINNTSTSHGFATNDDLAALCELIGAAHVETGVPLSMRIGTDAPGGTPFTLDALGNYIMGVRLVPASQRALSGPTGFSAMCTLTGPDGTPAHADGGNWYNNFYWDVYWRAPRYKRYEYLQAGLHVVPTFDYAPLTVNANARNAHATNVGGPIVDFLYDWGDGSPQEHTTDKLTTLTHTYDNPGSFRVSLLVTDSYGNTVSEWQWITARVDLRPDLAGLGGVYHPGFE